MYLSLAQITDREIIPGTALIVILILALVFKVTEISDCTYYALVHVRGWSFKRNSSVSIHYTPSYLYFPDTCRECLYSTADITVESDSTVNLLSGKRKTEILNAT